MAFRHGQPKQLPRVLKSYDPLPKSGNSVFKTKLQYFLNNPQALLDIREYVRNKPVLDPITHEPVIDPVTGEQKKYTGYTSKGLTLTKDQVIYLMNILPDVLRDMEDATTEISRQVEASKGKSETYQWDVSSTQELGGRDPNGETTEEIP